MIRAGAWDSSQAVARVTLAFDDRHRRRRRLVDDGGTDFLLDLDEAARLEDGDGLVLEAGGVIEVAAAPERVIDISCASASEAARVAWHLGNRHTPVQILGRGGLRIRDDHVLMDMVKGLGAVAVRRTAPFQPEAGAYAAGSGHGHSHDPEHVHEHDHGHGHGHGHHDHAAE